MKKPIATDYCYEHGAYEQNEGYDEYDDYDRQLQDRRVRIQRARRRRRRRTAFITAVILFAVLACGFTVARLMTIDDIFMSENGGDSIVTKISALFNGSGKKGDWNLVLVNWENPISSSFRPRLTETEDGYMFDERAVQSLEEMLAAAREEDLSPVITSAFRDYNYQQTLYTNKTQYYLDQGYTYEDAESEAATVVARPGTSEHQLGLAVDISSASYTALDSGQAQTAEFMWLEENCWRFGFIVRYPPDKMDVTGIIYEPWHFRYVGKDAAEDMYYSGQCLEEYLAK